MSFRKLYNIFHIQILNICVKVRGNGDYFRVLDVVYGRVPDPVVSLPGNQTFRPR